MKTTQPPELRAKDPIAKLLVNYLDVPMIFFDAPWPSKGKRVDVLAIDRAGSGDLHVVEIVSDLASGIKRIPQLLKVPAQFRWFAYLYEPTDLDADLAESDRIRRAPLFAPDDMGRVGVMQVRTEEDVHGEYLYGQVEVRAERFRGSNYAEAQRFIAQNKPDVDFK
jgi:hypothetical protein